MPHIATVLPEEADGEVAEIYQQIQGAMGMIPGAFRLYSVSPELLRQQWAFITHYQHHPALSGAFLAFLRLSVSREIHCDYCIGLNGALLLNFYGWTPAQLEAAKQERNSAPLNEKEKALLGYCIDAVHCFGNVEPARLDMLRQMGWSDRDVFEALAHATRNVASDILFNALGLVSETC